MKLRIKGDSVRLRLTRGEVAALLSEGRFEERVRFDLATSLTYRVRADSAVNRLAASFDGGTIDVCIPAEALRQWGDSEEVTLSSVQRHPGIELSVVVEKDFACLKPREGEDESDSFPHPLAGSG